MQNRRTDLALEAHALWCAEKNGCALSGVTCRERERCGYAVTSVEVTSPAAARKLAKPRGTYITLDLRPYWTHAADGFERAVDALACELRGLFTACGGGKNTLVVGLGNAHMTPDAVGSLAAEHILVTRHLMGDEAFAAFSAVSVLTPGVLGRTGMEAAEQVRGAVKTLRPDLVLAIDALASQRLGRVCSTVQLSNTGIVPGSGVGNHRSALDRAALGVPVIAIGVPTVVDAATLTLDVLEEAGISGFDPDALRGHETVMVTPRDIDAQIAELSRIIGYGIDLALQPQLSLSDLRALL